MQGIKLTTPTSDTERIRRAREADNQVHSQRMEGVEFTPEMIERQHRFAQGELSIDELLSEALDEARAG